jgi:hypothetical protein
MLLAAVSTAEASAPAVVTGDVALFGPASAPGSVNTPFVADARFTPMDLLRRVFPDLDNDGHYRKLLPVKVVSNATMPEIGAGYTQDPADPPLTMLSPSMAVVRDEHHAIGFVLGAGVLVSDWLLPVPAVGEAMFVQTDPGSDPSIDRAFAIGDGMAAALVVNEHHSAGEGFNSYALYAQGFDGLRQVYEGPLLYSFTRSTSACPNQSVIQSLEAHPLATRHGGHADIAMIVTESTECTGAATAVPRPRLFRITITWNARAKRYRGGSPALERLNGDRLAAREKE